MNSVLICKKGTRREVANACRTTINMQPSEKEVSDKYFKRLLLSEHSPIRRMSLAWKWTDLPYYVSTHFVRHKIGIEHFIRTQRTDRTGIDRSLIPQGAFVEHECEATYQAIINISRKRLCKCADEKTIEAWSKFLYNVVLPTDEVLYSVCVPQCVREGHCYEFKSCGYTKSENFSKACEEYRKI